MFELVSKQLKCLEVLLKRFPSAHSLLPFDEPGVLGNPVQIRPLTNETLNDYDVQGDLGIC